MPIDHLPDTQSRQTQQVARRHDKRKCYSELRVVPKSNQETESSANSFLISASVSIFLSCVASNLSPLFPFSLSSSIAFS